MDLIIKPTMACQFKCTFCSSNNISKEHTLFDLNILRPYLEKYNIGTVIINGGGPLLGPPPFFYKTAPPPPRFDFRHNQPGYPT